MTPETTRTELDRSWSESRSQTPPGPGLTGTPLFRGPGVPVRVSDPGAMRATSPGQGTGRDPRSTPTPTDPTHDARTRARSGGDHR